MATADDSLPTQKELDEVQQLRSRFNDEFSRRKAERRDHPCMFGDYALTRVLRGNDGDLEMSVKWLARCLKKIEQTDLDSMVKKCQDELSKPGVVPSDTMLPHFDKLKELVRAIFTAPELSPSGDLINYICLTNLDMWQLMSEGRWNEWVKYMHAATVLRLLECEQRSRKQGRLVRVITIMDVAGVTFSKVNCPAFHLAHNRDLGKFQESVAAEVFGPLYIINAPKLVQKVVTSITRMIPSRFARKLHVMQGDGLDSPDFVRLVGGEGQLRQMLQSQEALFAQRRGPAPVNTRQVIAQRQSLVHTVDLKAGQRVTWDFKLMPGSLDGPLGESDICFSAQGLWVSEWPQVYDNLRQDGMETLHPEESIRTSRGRVQGGLTASRPGIVWLRWSNAHSMMRSKTVKFCITQTAAVEEEKPEQPVATNGKSQGDAKVARSSSTSRRQTKHVPVEPGNSPHRWPQSPREEERKPGGIGKTFSCCTARH